MDVDKTGWLRIYLGNNQKHAAGRKGAEQSASHPQRIPFFFLNEKWLWIFGPSIFCFFWLQETHACDPGIHGNHLSRDCVWAAAAQSVAKIQIRRKRNPLVGNIRSIFTEGEMSCPVHTRIRVFDTFSFSFLILAHVGIMLLWTFQTIRTGKLNSLVNTVAQLKIVLDD